MDCLVKTIELIHFTKDLLKLILFSILFFFSIYNFSVIVIVVINFNTILSRFFSSSLLLFIIKFVFVMMNFEFDFAETNAVPMLAHQLDSTD